MNLNAEHPFQKGRISFLYFFKKWEIKKTKTLSACVKDKQLAHIPFLMVIFFLSLNNLHDLRAFINSDFVLNKRSWCGV